MVQIAAKRLDAGDAQSTQYAHLLSQSRLVLSRLDLLSQCHHGAERAIWALLCICLLSSGDDGDRKNFAQTLIGSSWWPPCLLETLACHPPGSEVLDAFSTLCAELLLLVSEQPDESSRRGPDFWTTGLAAVGAQVARAVDMTASPELALCQVLALSTPPTYEATGIASWHDAVLAVGAVTT